MFKIIQQRPARHYGLYALALILLVGIPRFIIVLGANATGDYHLVPVVFIVMMVLPFVLLNREGRKEIGIKKTQNYRWLFWGFLTGAAVCAIAFVVAMLLFGNSISNWFVYISKSYAVSKTGFHGVDRHIYFIIYAIIGMTFSPLGEELFYRGLVHGSLAKKFNNSTASNLDSLAFALTHLAHFGIVYMLGGWQLLLGPASLWVGFIFLASKVFFASKQKAGSIWGAVASHAGFNLAMMYFIFYWIL